MTTSMTGFAAAKGQGAGHGWSWDIRSVNGKGLDMRLRVPEWIDGLEAALRAELGQALQRGNVSLSLKLSRDGADGGDGLRVNQGVLGDVLTALAAIEDAAMARGVTLGQPTSADVLGFRGVLETAVADTDTAPLRAANLAGLPALIADFQAVRGREGVALGAVIAAQLTRIDTLTAQAQTEATARRDGAATTMRDAIAKVLAHTDAVGAGGSQNRHHRRIGPSARARGCSASAAAGSGPGWAQV